MGDESFDLGHVGNITGSQFVAGDGDVMIGGGVVASAAASNGAFHDQRDDRHRVADLLG
jgi:hypothetical protein